MSDSVFDLLLIDTPVAKSIEWFRVHGFVMEVDNDHYITWYRNIGGVIDNGPWGPAYSLTLFASLGKNSSLFSAWCRKNGAFLPTVRNQSVEEAFKELCSKYPLEAWIKEGLQETMMFI